MLLFRFKMYFVIKFIIVADLVVIVALSYQNGFVENLVSLVTNSKMLLFQR